MNRLAPTLLAASLVLAAAPAFAQQWPPLDDIPQVEKTGAGDVAVVVAVEDYAFLPDVPGAAKNAAEWEQFLKDGLGVDSVLMLTNQQAVKEEILDFAKRGAANTKEGSTLWFVFIGHGAPSSSGEDGLLIGADGQQNANSMQARGVPQKDLLAALEGGKQAKTVVLIDACFSGRDASGGALAKGTMPVMPVTKAPVVKTTTVVMTAAKADEFAGALPDSERPAFSYLVLGAMRGWADDGDGEVTADEAVTFARRELLGIPGRQQTPQLTGTDSVILAKGVAEAKPSISAAVDETAEKPPAGHPPSDTIGTAQDAKVVPPEYTDGIPDNPFYAFANFTVGAVDNFGDLGPGADFGAGVKLNGFTGGPSEWRFGLRFGLASTTNSSAPESGQAINGGEVFSDDTVQNASAMTFVVGPEVGKSWRSESGPRAGGDAVFTVSAMGLYGIRNACSSWSVDTSSGEREITCTPESSSGPGGAIGAAFQYGVIQLGAKIGWVVDIDFVSSLNLGLTFDI